MVRVKMHLLQKHQRSERRTSKSSKVNTDTIDIDSHDEDDEVDDNLETLSEDEGSEQSDCESQSASITEHVTLEMIFDPDCNNK